MGSVDVLLLFREISEVNLTSLDATLLGDLVFNREKHKENTDQDLERLAAALLSLYPMSVNETLPSD